MKIGRQVARMFSGYESPITQIMGEMQMQMENDCMKVVQQCGFDVNKEELARALIYDREQYNKGYDDGYTKAIDDFERAIKGRLIDYLQNTILFNEFEIKEIAEQLKEGDVDG